MFSRPMLLVGVLVASVIIPYVLLDKNLSQTAKAQLRRLTGRSEADDSADPLASLKLPWAEGESATAASPAPASAAALLPVTLEEAFRFDVTPQAVTSRWPRVSTVLGEPNQLGMRVAFASGTQPHDVAGSLTYYFDDHHQLQRITFYGLTGDEQRLLAYLVNTYRLKTAPTTGVARYVAGPLDKPTSQVSVRHLPVVLANAAYARVEVAVDLNRGNAARVSPSNEAAPLPQAYRPW
jgi:hypothetical protein